MKRKMRTYKELFYKYEELCDIQDALYDGKIDLPEDKKKEFNELQIKKMSILTEMDLCL